MREIFQLVYLNRGGTIDAKEMIKLFDLLGMQKWEVEIEDISNDINN